MGEVVYNTSTNETAPASVGRADKGLTTAAGVSGAEAGAILAQFSGTTPGIGECVPFAFNGGERRVKSGVYVFWRVGSGVAEYVGSSKNVKRRIGVHLRELRKGLHVNQMFQRAWNKYGAAAYHVIQIEICAEAQLIEREQFWMEALKPVRNISVYAGAPTRGLKLSAEHRAKIGAAARGRAPWCKGRKIGPRPADVREKIRAAQVGEKNHMYGGHQSPDARARISATTKGRPGKPVSEEARAKIGKAQAQWQARVRFKRDWMEPT